VVLTRSLPLLAAAASRAAFICLLLLCPLARTPVLIATLLQLAPNIRGACRSSLQGAGTQQ
jgi:hypothetical protein